VEFAQNRLSSRLIDYVDAINGKAGCCI